MPFLTPDRKPHIRHPQGHPVAVRVAFNVVGDFVPRSICIEDDYSELFKYRIAAIKNIKDKYMIREFLCSYDAYGYRNDIMLIFDVVKCQWVIG